MAFWSVLLAWFLTSVLGLPAVDCILAWCRLQSVAVDLLHGVHFRHRIVHPLELVSLYCNTILLIVPESIYPCVFHVQVAISLWRCISGLPYMCLSSAFENGAGFCHALLVQGRISYFETPIEPIYTFENLTLDALTPSRSHLNSGYTVESIPTRGNGLV